MAAAKQIGVDAATLAFSQIFIALFSNWLWQEFHLTLWCAAAHHGVVTHGQSCSLTDPVRLLICDRHTESPSKVLRPLPKHLLWASVGTQNWN